MTWRRLTRAEADAEARAEFRQKCLADRAFTEEMRRLWDEDEARREAALAETRPMLKEMTSAQLLDVLHAGTIERSQPLPCDDADVFGAVFGEVERRRAATGHERIRLRDLDRRG